MFVTKMGACINAIVIIICSLIGLKLQQGVISERIQERINQGLGLSVLALGMLGIIETKNQMVMILSMLLGAIIGEWLDLDGKLVRLTNYLEARMEGNPAFQGFGQGFLAATLLMCIGSMAIVGAIESGLRGNDTTLISKSILDGIAAILLASSLGIGVLFAAIPVFVLEGSITLFARWLAPVLSDALVVAIVSTGSILLFALGLNLLNITKIKLLNLLPAMVLPILLIQFF